MIAGDVQQQRVRSRWIRAGSAPRNLGSLRPGAIDGERPAADLGTTPTRVQGGEHFVPEDHRDVVAAAVDELLPTAHPVPSEEPT